LISGHQRNGQVSAEKPKYIHSLKGLDLKMAAVQLHESKKETWWGRKGETSIT